MAEFKTMSDSNTKSISKVIKGFQNLLKSEREALSFISSDIKVENVELTSFIVSKIEKLHANLTTKNKIIDELAEKTKKAKVPSIKLKNATNHIMILRTRRLLSKAVFLK